MLVEGSGPAASPYQGQGWGGGGARYGERYGRGLQGLVLVEIQTVSPPRRAQYRVEAATAENEPLSKLPVNLIK